MGSRKCYYNNIGKRKEDFMTNNKLEINNKINFISSSMQANLEQDYHDAHTNVERKEINKQIDIIYKAEQRIIGNKRVNKSAHLFDKESTIAIAVGIQVGLVLLIGVVAQFIF